MTRILICIVSFLLFSGTIAAQTEDILPADEKLEEIPVILYKKAQKEWYIDDSIEVFILPEIPVYPPLKFKNQKEIKRYNRLVYNVKKTLPIAKRANMLILETYEILETLPDKKSKEEHIKAVEKSIKKDYTPQVKKLTLSQGKLLIKLINRECNQSAYRIINAFFGPLKSGFYQTIATVCGASLKKEYDPEEDDKMVERVVRMVESGQL
ncbi:MAG: DUF4294 domain-containing protein [Paraprevotella sp.]|nr:DUF4294 domain-containing protein [Paraprevotella sp.]